MYSAHQRNGKIFLTDRLIRSYVGQKWGRRRENRRERKRAQYPPFWAFRHIYSISNDVDLEYNITVQQNSIDRPEERKTGKTSMGANLTIQHPSRRHHCSHRCDPHCHCCCSRRSRQDDAKRDDAPLNQLISVAVDYLRAEMEIRRGRRADEVVDRERQRERERGMEEDMDVGGSSGRERLRNGTRAGDGSEELRRKAGRRRERAEREGEEDQPSPLTHMLPREPTPVPDEPAPMPENQLRCGSRALSLRQETGMDPLPPPIHRPQVDESCESPCTTEWQTDQLTSQSTSYPSGSVQQCPTI